MPSFDMRAFPERLTGGLLTVQGGALVTGKPHFDLHEIIWAFDAFEDVPQLHRQAAHVFSYFAPVSALKIQPLFVLTPNQLDISPDLATPWIEEYLPSAKENLARAISEVTLPGLQSPVVIAEPTSSLSQSVDAVIDYADQNTAELIVVSSHGRSGLKRLLEGSFSETLLHRSKIPVMVVGQRTKIQPELKRIVFPTEFGDHSRSIFRQVTALARRVGAAITLLHVIPRPDEPVLSFNYDSRAYPLGGDWVPFRVFRAHQIEHQTRRAKSWTEWATHEGVECEFIIDTNAENVANAILNLAAQKETGLLMMEAQSRPIREMILGSTTQTIVRKGPCPIWIFTSHWVESALREAA